MATLGRIRPVGVLVLAIFWLIFGVLRLCAPCGRLMPFGFTLIDELAKKAPKGPGGQPLPPNAEQETQTELLRTVSHYRVFLISSLVVHLVVAALQITGGFGLLFMKKWARTLILILSVVILVQLFAELGYEFSVVQPVRERHLDAMPPGPFDMRGMAVYFAILGAIPTLILTIASFIVLTRSATLGAFENASLDVEDSDLPIED